MGAGGPVALDHTPIWKAIEEYGIKDKLRTFEGVLLIADHLLKLYGS